MSALEQLGHDPQAEEFASELGEWVELRNTVNQLCKTEAWEYYRKFVQGKIKILTHKLLEQETKDHAQIAAEVRGLQYALQAFESLGQIAAEMIEAIQQKVQEEEKADGS